MSSTVAAVSYRTNNPENHLPAAAVASGTGTVVFFSAFGVTLQARLWHAHHLAAYGVALASGLVAGLAVFLVARAVFRRIEARWWHIAIALTAVLGLASTTPAAAAYVFPDLMDRYHAELGGPGRCLSQTPYATEKSFPKASQITFDDTRPGLMTVTPLDTSFPRLTLNHAVDGGIHHLTPADSESAQILAAHHC